MQPKPTGFCQAKLGNGASHPVYLTGKRKIRGQTLYVFLCPYMCDASSAPRHYTSTNFNMLITVNLYP